MTYTQYRLDRFMVFLNTMRYTNINFHSNRKSLLDLLKWSGNTSNFNGTLVDISDEKLANLISILMLRNTDIDNNVRLNFTHLYNDLKFEYSLEHSKLCVTQDEKEFDEDLKRILAAVTTSSNQKDVVNIMKDMNPPINKDVTGILKKAQDTIKEQLEKARKSELESKHTDTTSKDQPETDTSMTYEQ